MLTNELPFHGDTISAIYRQILEHDPAPLESRLSADVPAPLIRVIERCLEKAPEDRPQRLAEVVHVLAAVQRALPQREGTQDWIAPTPQRPPNAHLETRLGRNPRHLLTSQLLSRPWLKPVAWVGGCAIVITTAAVLLAQAPQNPPPAIDQQAPSARFSPGNDAAPGSPLAVPPGTAQLDNGAVILISNEPQVSERLLPLLYDRFEVVVESDDPQSGRERFPNAGRTLNVTASISNRIDTAFGTTLSSCEVRGTARLLDARDVLIDSVSASEVAPACDGALDSTASKLVAQLRFR